MKSIYASLLIVLVAFIPPGKKGLEAPSYFPQPVYDFRHNPLDSATIQLGRVMFYDPVLSADNRISCASCHSPFNAFAHTDHALSHGINDQTGKRNAPALMNLAWQSSFMWDGAVNHLDMQALAPISHPGEMGSSILEVIAKMKSSELYPTLFFRAFHDSAITGERVLKAFAQFELTLVSAGSKYDQVKKGNDQFTRQEERGYQLFLSNCNSCHREPLFTNGSFANNGLPPDSVLFDTGRYVITKDPKDSLLFKIPSLRNLSYTYPYMHDGRFRTLQQVLAHYTGNVMKSRTLSNELQQPLCLSAEEKVDLIAFLLTLNDRNFVFDSRHTYPREILLTQNTPK